jgi:hypothetical protein
MLSALRSWKSWLLILASAGLLCGEAAWCVEKIRLGLSTRDKKLFDKYGLDVEIIQGIVTGDLSVPFTYPLKALPV